MLDEALLAKLVRIGEASDPSLRRKLAARLLQPEQLTFQERRFVDEYVVDMDANRAAVKAGFKRGASLVKGRGTHVLVPDAIRERLDKMSEVSELKAEFVRDYIHDVLNLCPTDCFDVNEAGDWCIDPAAFAALPHSVRRLVESIEEKHSGGKRVFKVNFVSKSQALALAARYTLTEKHEVAVAQIPWDDISSPPEDAIERRIADVGVPHGSNGVCKIPLAGGDVLPPAADGD